MMAVVNLQREIKLIIESYNKKNSKHHNRISGAVFTNLFNNVSLRWR